jgi:predicted Zn finger-like uncharacterized protein
MLIVCPTCATSYDVETASLRPNGRQVRCVRCRTVWRAELSQADKLIAAAEALAPVRRAVEAMAEAAAEPPGAALPPTEPAGVLPDSDDVEAVDAPPVALAEEPPTAAMPKGFTPGMPVDDVVAVDSPPIAPVDLDTAPPPLEAPAADTTVPAEEPSVDIETVAARRFRPGLRRKKRGWPLSRLQSAILALVIVDGIVVGWRTDFVRALPQTASFYAAIGMPVNLRGVAFDGLTTNTEQHEGVPILVVEGNIVNNAGRMVDVPRLRFAVRNAAREEIYSWTAVPPRAALPPGEGVGFRTRLASPPPDSHDVLVRFVNRFDMLSGSR